MRNVKINAIASATTALLLMMASVPSMSQQVAPMAPQPGVVYPGGVAPGQAAKGAAPAQPGQPGAAMNAAPALPALPGGQPQMMPAQPPVRAGSVALDDAMPSNLANDVDELKRRLDAFDQAAAKSATKVAKPVTRSITITQAAGEEVPVVRVAPGVPTNVVFIDSTGQPWPVAYATPGDSNRFEVILPEAGASSLQVRPKAGYGYGGTSVTLRGNTVPISLSFVVGQSEVDARLDVKVNRRGPNAAAPIIDRTGLPNATDVSLMSFLDGVPPQGTREVKTSSASVRAWIWNDRMVVRSELPVVSPAWTDNTASPSGVTSAYILPVVPSILVASEGRMVTVKIEN